MKEIQGEWWTLNGQPVPGTLVITNANQILLTTYSKLKDSNVINSFAESERITLVDVKLDSTKIYYGTKGRNLKNDITMEPSEEIIYYIYTYKAQLCILGYNYKRKGSIILESR